MERVSYAIIVLAIIAFLTELPTMLDPGMVRLDNGTVLEDSFGFPVAWYAQAFLLFLGCIVYWRLKNESRETLQTG